MSVFDLQQTEANKWIASYRGNYGNYRIKIVLQDNKIQKYSCTCPSDYTPCKHIPIVYEKIQERLTQKNNQKSIGVEEILKYVSDKELRQFVIQTAENNQDFSQSVILQFAKNLQKATEKEEKNDNKYKRIIGKELSGLHFEEEDIWEFEEIFEIDILDNWFEKIREYLNDCNYTDAVLICKACIEEYAKWLADSNDYMLEYTDDMYEEHPFSVLEKIVQRTEEFSEDLYIFCKTEMVKNKYVKCEMVDYFADLLPFVTPISGEEQFIKQQDTLIDAIEDKSSSRVENILQRKINFYETTKQLGKAMQVMRDNLQILNFRKSIVLENIEAGKYSEAKKLILECSTEDGSKRYDWTRTLLHIAQGEKDMSAIRKLSYSLISSFFKKDDYQIYKSTFTKEEWKEEMKKVINHYQGDRKCAVSCVLEVLYVEGMKAQLQDYLALYPSIQYIEKYYMHFPSTDQALKLLKKSINQYAIDNIGRNHYEYIKRLLELMKTIPGGKTEVQEMLSNFKILYKKRSAMMEILNIR